MGSYIDDAGGGERQFDSYLGNPDTIFHGENDEFTRQLDAKMIAKLTPEERLKMGAELPGTLAARVEAAAEKATEDLIARRKAQPELPKHSRGALTVMVIVLALLALLAVVKLAHGAENPLGNSLEIPVKTPVPASSPAPSPR